MRPQPPLVSAVLLFVDGRSTVRPGNNGPPDPEEVAARIGKVIRPPVIWLHFQDCTGCTETLLRPSHPDLGDLILNVISLEYHETLMAGSGKQAEESLRDAIARYAGKYVCVVEGSIPTRDNGVYMKLAGRPAMEVLQRVGRKAAAIIAIGSCGSMFDTPELRDFSNICRGNFKSLRERCNPALTSRILNGGGTSKYCKVTAAIDKISRHSVLNRKSSQ